MHMYCKFLRLLAPLFVCFSSLHAATVQFSARQDIPTHSKHLTGLAVADFNGDGKLDIAITDDYSQTVSVYLNDGTGHFGAPVTTTLNVPSIGGLGALVAGDVNEDGKQDLIVAPVAGLQYDVVLIGKGDGTFTQSEQIPGSYGFESAALVDINGDKHLDLVAGGNGSLFVHLGDGKGNFTQQPITSASGLYLGLAVGDFNGDKHLDFVAANFTSNQLSFYPGIGDGSFKTAAAIQSSDLFSTSSLASADFNGDGKLDLLVGESDIAYILAGNGDGTFQTDSSKNPPVILAPTLSPGPQVGVAPIVATADMDGNGSPDIVAADDGSGKLSVLLNDGTGKFSVIGPDFTAALDAGSESVQLADLNGDGLPDVIVTNYKTQNISIFLSVIPKTTPAIAIQSSAAQALAGSNVTITVQVKGTGTTTPTGSVALASGSTSYGQQNLDPTGQATFTLQSLATGQYSLVATYSGDKYYGGTANTTGVTQAITDFQVSLPSATQTVAAGASATYTVSLSPIAGFSGPVALSCSGLPSGYNCAPVSAPVSGQALTASVVVSPPAMIAALKPASKRSPAAPALAMCTSLCLCLAFRRRRGFYRATLLALLSVSLGLTGCSNSRNAEPPAYTGTSSFMITATATQGSQTVSHQIAATLAVH